MTTLALIGIPFAAATAAVPGISAGYSVPLLLTGGAIAGSILTFMILKMLGKK